MGTKHSTTMRLQLLLGMLCMANAHTLQLHNHVDRVLRKLHAVVPETATNATTHFYDSAVLDHFLASVASPKASKWSQRYYVDQTHWCGAGCPIFVYIGGEGPQGPPSSRLFMSTLAAEAGALTVALEHRFFGESYPTPDMSDTSLKYLSSNQALADLARFISYIKAATPGSDPASTPALQLKASAATSKFVTFGGSYPGNLAAWFKLKYPALTVGSVASSAPVFAEYNYEQYAQVVGDALGNPGIGGSKECASLLTQGVEAFAKGIHIGGCDVVGVTKPDGCPCSHKWDCTTPTCSAAAGQPPGSPTCGGIAPVPHALRPCTAPNSTLDIAQYQSSVFGQFQGVVQYNEETRGPTVNSTCAAVVAQSVPLEALAAGVAATLGVGVQDAPCVASNFQQSMDEELTNITFSGRGCGLDCTSSRQWIFMSCNEFGYFQTTTGENQPFAGLKAVDIKFSGYETCRAAFNVSDDYAGPKRNAEELMASQQERVVFIKDTAHCRDMYAPGVFESIGV